MVVYDKCYVKNKERPQYVKKDNNKIRRVPLANKIATQKSLCTDCSSRKSTFLKPMKSNKKQK